MATYSKKMAMGMVFLMVIIVFAGSAAAQKGATVTNGTPETQTTGTAGSIDAEGGNITSINVTVTGAQTTHWQGFWGQVSGAITLEDATGNQLFNWTMGTMSGNVYISNYSSVTFTSVTAAAAGACNGITGTGDDSCTNTFNDGTKSFTIAGSAVTNVNLVKTFNYTGTAVWDEGLVNDSSNRLIYVATIYNNANTFKNGAADFQAIVPVNGTATRTYYFWLELGV
jgi:hypothetical protein